MPANIGQSRLAHEIKFERLQLSFNIEGQGLQTKAWAFYQRLLYPLPDLDDVAVISPT